MEKHKNFIQDKSGLEKNFMRLDIIENNSSQIKLNKLLKLFSVSLFILSVIMSFKLLINLLFPSLSFGSSERTIMISSCLGVNIVASLILYKYQSLHENLADNLNNVIKQFKMGNVERLVLDTMENFLEANKKMEQLLGLSEAELLAMNRNQVFPDEALERSRSTLEKVFQTVKSDKAKDRKIRKDDRRVPVNFVASKVEYGHKPMIQGIFRDIAECGKPDHIQVQHYRDHLSFLQNFFKIPS